MNLDQLKEIIRLFEGSSLTALDVQVQGECCRLRRDPVGEARPVIQQVDSAPARRHPLPAGEGQDFNFIL